MSTSAVISGKNNASPAASLSRRLETATSARKAALSAVTQHAGETRPSRRQRFPTWASDEEDSSWELISKKKLGQKRAVLYVGNLASSTTEENLKRFISSKSEKVGIEPPRMYNIRIFHKENGHAAADDDICGARKTVGEVSFADLADRSFWPSYVYARPWKFRDSDKAVKSGETQESASPAEQTA